MKLVICPILSFCMIILSICPLFAQDFAQNTRYGRAEITHVAKKDFGTAEEQDIETVFSLRILDGPLKGVSKTVTFRGKDSAPQYMKYHEGDTVFIGENTLSQNGKTEIYISLYDKDNTAGIVVLAIIFLIALVAIARLRGITAFVGLGVTIMLLFYIFVPLTMKGFPPLISAVLISLISIAVTIPIITGLTKKSLAGIIGASSGVIIAVLLTLIVSVMIHLSGIITDELLTIFYVSNVEIDLRDVALSGMIISALGAVIDISVSISSSVNEICAVHKNITRAEAFKSAIAVGKDNLGSMVNTLVMSYVGSSIALVLVISLKYNSDMPLRMILNNNEVLIEIVKSIVGCMGMLAAVPVTAYAGTRLFCKASKD